MRVLRRERPIILVALFFLMAPILIYEGDCISEATSVFNLVGLYTFFTENWYLFALGFLSFYSVFFLKIFAKIILPISLLVFSLELFWMYFQTDGKVLLFYSSIFLIFGILFYTLWLQAMEDALYVPNFRKNRLGDIGNAGLEIKLSSEWEEGLIGKLTSWSERSMFIALDGLERRVFPSRIGFNIDFEGVSYQGEGTVITTFEDGLGIRIKEAEIKNRDFGWKDFYNIIEDRGLV